MTETLEVLIGLFLIGYGLNAWRHTERNVYRRNRRILRRSLRGLG